jgi:hypothetical protein
MVGALLASKVRMPGVRIQRLVLGVTLLLGVAHASVAAAGPSVDPSSTSVTDPGGALTFGFGVSPLRPELPAPLAAIPGGQGGESGRPTDFDSRGTALSFDFTLRWPGSEAAVPLEPYLAVGPALFVVEPDYPRRLLGTHVDSTFRLGAKVGAGLNWRLSKDVTLFGAYEVTTSGDTAFGAKPAGDSAVGGYDFTYGLRFRY